VLTNEWVFSERVRSVLIFHQNCQRMSHGKTMQTRISFSLRSQCTRLSKTIEAGNWGFAGKILKARVGSPHGYIGHLYHMEYSSKIIVARNVSSFHRAAHIDVGDDQYQPWPAKKFVRELFLSR